VSGGARWGEGRFTLPEHPLSPPRREFLRLAGSAAAWPALESALSPLAAASAPAPGSPPFGSFRSIEPSSRDEVVLPDGFVHDLVIKWGDPFTAAGETFGYNNDWIGVFALGSDEEALLTVNQEYISVAYLGDVALYPLTFERLRGRAATIEDFKRDVGLSVLRVRRDGATGGWTPVLKDPLNRRISAFTPCAVDGPAAALMGADKLQGTFDNCAGQTTPWRTALTCEENFQARVPELVDAKGRFVSGGVFDLPGGHYGWVVEVDPYDPGSTPVKHTALGRFRHENVGLRAQPGHPVAGYMGDDRLGGHLWKFVSDAVYSPSETAGHRKLLSSGRLYAARFHPDGGGEWRLLDLSSPLDPNLDAKDPKPFIPPHARTLADCYATQGAALMDAYQAANALGASPSGRPEDIEVHADGSVVVAFTSQSDRPGLWENIYGGVWRIVEEGDDVRATRFRWERLAVGGPNDPAQGGRVFAQPDNLIFDARGDLWMCSDISGALVNEDPRWSTFRNNGLFHVPMSGPRRGQPTQFASMPCEAESTGPAWAPREQALFLSVQHPGERMGIRTAAEQAPRGSNWPHGTLGAPPQPAVIAIRRR
jgi:secreted PhoX family phosphatase